MKAIDTSLSFYLASEKWHSLTLKNKQNFAFSFEIFDHFFFKKIEKSGLLLLLLIYFCLN
jgi:hypothetical protein